MRIDDEGAIVLSRRNLQALLNKLDREDSTRTIMGGSRALGVTVKAEPDQEHYAEVPFAGAVVPEDDPGIDGDTQVEPLPAGFLWWPKLPETNQTKERGTR